MRILSYNIYGVKETNSPIPIWETRQKNIKRILDTLLKDDEIKVCCFQEVNENNMNALNVRYFSNENRINKSVQYNSNKK